MEINVDYDLIHSIKGHYNAFICDITKELDTLVGFDDTSCGKYHYIMKCFDSCISIRFLGSTVGGIYTGINNIITKIVIDDDSIHKYPKYVNKVMEKYIGKMLVITERSI